MPTLRRATLADAPTITRHRHLMFADNNFATDAHLSAMDAAFHPWLLTHLAANTYIGLFLEEDGQILAGAGIFLMEFPPHWMHFEPRRAYLLNFYTSPEARGRGFAKQLVKASLDECRRLNVDVVTLHASQYGRPIYEKLGFTPTTEMMFRLNP
jgi:GNAT superfamily N-acetyltransferase